MLAPVALEVIFTAFGVEPLTFKVVFLLTVTEATLPSAFTFTFPPVLDTIILELSAPLETVRFKFLSVMLILLLSAFSVNDTAFFTVMLLKSPLFTTFAFVEFTTIDLS